MATTADDEADTSDDRSDVAADEPSDDAPAAPVEPSAAEASKEAQPESKPQSPAAAARTLLKPAPRIAAPPKVVPPPPSTSTTTGPRATVPLAMEFDLGEERGPAQLSKLTAGPARTARPGVKPEPIVGDPARLADLEALAELAGAKPAATEAGASEKSGESEAESSGRSGQPRLPVPGMLGKMPAHEFRDARRPAKPGSGAGVGAGIVPPGGVVPPGAPDEGHIAPEDTGLLIDDVAAELMEPDPASEQQPALAPAAKRTKDSDDDVAVPVFAAAATAHTTDTAPTDSRMWIMGTAAVALLLLAIWAIAGGDDEASETKPGSATLAANDAADRDAQPSAKKQEHSETPTPSPADDPPVAAEPTPAKPADEAEAGADAVEPDAAAEPAAEPEVAIVDEEAEPAPTQPASGDASSSSKSSSSGSSSKKSSSKSSKSSSSADASTSKDDSEKKDDQAAKATTEEGEGSSDAEKLLKQARAAYEGGNGPKAYSLAAKSNRLESSTAALEVMALASCLKGDKERALSLVKQLPLFRRPVVRNKCKTHGVKLGI